MNLLSTASPVLLLIAGLVVCFFGYRLLRLTLGLAGSGRTRARVGGCRAHSRREPGPDNRPRHRLRNPRSGPRDGSLQVRPVPAWRRRGRAGCQHHRGRNRLALPDGRARGWRNRRRRPDPRPRAVAGLRFVGPCGRLGIVLGAFRLFGWHHVAAGSDRPPASYGPMVACWLVLGLIGVVVQLRSGGSQKKKQQPGSGAARFDSGASAPDNLRSNHTEGSKSDDCKVLAPRRAVPAGRGAVGCFNSAAVQQMRETNQAYSISPNFELDRVWRIAVVPPRHADTALPALCDRAGLLLMKRGTSHSSTGPRSSVSCGNNGPAALVSSTPIPPPGSGDTWGPRRS